LQELQKLFNKSEEEKKGEENEYQRIGRFIEKRRNLAGKANVFKRFDYEAVTLLYTAESKIYKFINNSLFLDMIYFTKENPNELLQGRYKELIF
jgi:hypothetical protein